MNGVTGFIQFYQPYAGAPVTITVHLWGLDQYAETYEWHVREFSVYYPGLNRFPCSEKYLGDHFDPLGASAYSNYTARCATNPEYCEVGDLSGRLGPIKAKREQQVFVDENLDLCGPLSPLGRSIVINRMDGSPWVCANIPLPVTYAGARIQTAKYVFNGLFQGEILFRRMDGLSTWETFLFASDNITVERNLSEIMWSLRRGNCDDPKLVCSR